MKKLMYSLALSLLSLGAFAQAGCPTMTMLGPSSGVKEGEQLQITVSVRGDGNFTYNWSVSAGTIESGQGTSSITVNTEGLAGQSVTATVELGGTDPSCNRTNSFTAEVISNPKTKLISAKSFTTARALIAQVDTTVTNLSLDLNDYASGTAFIYLYPGPKTTPAELKKMKADIVKEFNKKKVFDHMYKIVTGGKRKKACYEIWFLPVGLEDPAPTKD